MERATTDTVPRLRFVDILGRVASFVRGNPALTVSALLLMLMLAFTLFPSLFTPYGVNDQDIMNTFKPGFWSSKSVPGHPLGTDGVGRDLWARLVYSFGLSMPISLGAMALSLVVATVISMVSVTVGGWVDTVLMRLTDVQMAFPFIVLVIVIISMVRPNPVVILLVLGLGSWPFFGRFIRAFGVSTVTSDYVLAVRAMGGGARRIILQHLVRNIMPGVIGMALIEVGGFVVLEGTLSFLGLGVQSPAPSFGNIIASGTQSLNSAPWITILPGLCIVIVVYTLNLFGDSLIRFIDPLLRTQSRAAKRHLVQNRVMRAESPAVGTAEAIANPENRLSVHSEDDSLLVVQDLKTYYGMGERGVLKAVDGISFELNKGETLGIIGESGSGKSTVSRALIRLVGQPGYIAGGQIRWKGQALLRLSERQVTKFRGRGVGLVFQDPTTSLNPLLSVGDQLLETVQVHLNLDDNAARRLVLETLALVGIKEGDEVFHKYSCDYSAGFRQRIMIAMAIVCRPDLLIADEPTTVLGVTVQAQILHALRSLQKELGMAMIVITHDFGVVSEMSDKIMVMYGGLVMEHASKREFLLNPRHPYTIGLIGSVPLIEARRSRRLQVIPGFPPDMLKLPTGCPFAPRCRFAQPVCLDDRPPFVELNPGHWISCHFPVSDSERDAIQQLDMDRTTLERAL